METTTIYEKETLLSKLDEAFANLQEYVRQAAGHTEIHQTEKGILERLIKMGLLALKLYVQECGTGYQPNSAPREGDKPLPYKGTYKCKYFSIFGEFEIIRARYLKPSGEYYYPLDQQLSLPQEKYSYLLQQWIQEHAVEVDYREAVKWLNDMFGYSLCPSVSQRLGDQLVESVETFNDTLAPPAPETEGACLAISADGKGVRIVSSERSNQGATPGPKIRRGKGEKPGLKKEAVVTTDFTFNPEPRTPEEIVSSLLKNAPRQDRQRISDNDSSDFYPREALNKHLNVTLNGKDEAMAYLIERIKKRDARGEKPLVVLLDGDSNLERALYKALESNDYLGRVDAMILDIIHVAEYVWDVANALFGEKNPERYPWVEEKLLIILQGKVGRVIGGLRQMLSKNQLSSSQLIVIKKAITYFDNHRHMMDYGNYLAKGYHIATGLIESACGSLVKKRMEGNGMRWSIKGAQAILKQRAVKKNGDWQQFWQSHINMQKARLYPDSYRLAA